MRFGYGRGLPVFGGEVVVFPDKCSDSERISVMEDARLFLNEAVASGVVDSFFAEEGWVTMTGSELDESWLPRKKKK